MRLINTTTLSSESFTDDTVPPHTILSYMWGDDADELTYQDTRHGNTGVNITRWHKLQGYCTLAQKCGLQYIWMDTCCIDKTNLVELNESINSVFRWYSSASICYVYLADVPTNDELL